MKHAINLVLTLLLILTIPGCASQSNSIAPAYVSGSKYKDYSCEQLSTELEAIDARLAIEAKRQDDAAAKDAALVAAAIIIFPVTLFWLGGDTPQELARMKGEAEALKAEMRFKGCR